MPKAEWRSVVLANDSPCPTHNSKSDPLPARNHEPTKKRGAEESQKDAEDGHRSFVPRKEHHSKTLTPPFA
jgi:hypothetical protein